ncbi:MAG: LysE family transporter [Candidatus Freyarchaeum deiterrae]
MSFIIGLSGALTPGPLLVVTINKSLEGGFRKGGFTVFGHLILEAPLILLLCLGLGTFLNQNWIKIALAIIGGSGLIILGGYTIFSVWKKKINYPLNEVEENHAKGGAELVNITNDFEEKNWKQRTLNNPVVLGLTATASNPFFWIWWVTVGVAILTYGPTLAGVTTSSPLYWILGSYAGLFFQSGFDLGYLIVGSVALGWIFLAAGHFSSDLAWYTVVSFAVGRGRVLLNQRKYEIIIAICGVALVILGAWFLLSSVL